jgi:hypothetical protein
VQIIPPPNALSSYEVREFSDAEFSSFAQLIGFTRGINRVLQEGRSDDVEKTTAICARTDTMMTAWCNLLPKSKRSLLREDGSVDELMFKANMLMHVYVLIVASFLQC